MFKRFFKSFQFFLIFLFVNSAFSQENEFNRHFITSNNIKTIVAHDSAWHDATQDISGIGGPESVVNNFIYLFDNKGNLQSKSQVPNSPTPYSDLSKSNNYDLYSYIDTIPVRHEKIEYGQPVSIVKYTILNGKKNLAFTYGKDTAKVTNKDSFAYDSKGRLSKWYKYYYKFGKPMPKHMYGYVYDSFGRISIRTSSEWDGKWLAYTTYYYYDSKGRETEFGDVENGYYNKKYTVRYDDSRNVSDKTYFEKDKATSREIGEYDNKGNVIKLVRISTEEGRWIIIGNEYVYNSKYFKISQVNYTRIAKKKEIPGLREQSIEETFRLLPRIDLKVYEEINFNYSFYK